MAQRTPTDRMGFMPHHLPAEHRGHANHGWLDSYHSFSFADYHNPAWMGFSTLRVINEDVVAGGTGFGMHPHRDMEILTWILSGRLRHQDSLGTTAEITPGELQRMTAGTGIVHSEMNPSPSEPVHLLQMWLLPAQRGLKPGYDQQRCDPQGRFQAVATQDGREGSIALHADAALYIARLDAGVRIALPNTAGRSGWLQIARGTATLGEVSLSAGDGVGFDPGEGCAIQTTGPCELLFFDLPA